MDKLYVVLHLNEEQEADVARGPPPAPRSDWWLDEPLRDCVPQLLMVWDLCMVSVYVFGDCAPQLLTVWDLCTVNVWGRAVQV